MEQSRDRHLGKALHLENIGIGLGLLLAGAALLALEPVFGIGFRFKRFTIPPIVVQIVAGVIAAVGLLCLAFLSKTQSVCKACKARLLEGEAAFPEELDDTLRPHLRALDAAALAQAPVGSRFGDGPHYTLNYCPKCRQVAEMTLNAKPDGHEFKDRLVVGAVVSELAAICERHEEVRDSNNARVAGGN